MRHAAGYGVWTDRVTGSVLAEADTAQCSHCQAHIFLKPGTACTVYRILDRATLRWSDEAGAWCTVCNGPVCLACHADGRCRPFLEELAVAETDVAKRDIRARLGWTPIGIKGDGL